VKFAAQAIHDEVSDHNRMLSGMVRHVGRARAAALRKRSLPRLLPSRRAPTLTARRG
jgi:hypothetical protein